LLCIALTTVTNLLNSKGGTGLINEYGAGLGKAHIAGVAFGQDTFKGHFLRVPDTLVHEFLPARECPELPL